MPRALIAAIVLLAAGWWGATWYKRHALETEKKYLHMRIANVRTYEEGYALRTGEYVPLGDSCGTPGPGWAELGLTPPTKEEGCFRAEHVFAEGSTTPAGLRIIGLSPTGHIRGVETTDDRQPKWTVDTKRRLE